MKKLAGIHTMLATGWENGNTFVAIAVVVVVAVAIAVAIANAGTYSECRHQAQQ